MTIGDSSVSLTDRPHIVLAMWWGPQGSLHLEGGPILMFNCDHDNLNVRNTRMIGIELRARIFMRIKKGVSYLDLRRSNPVQLKFI